MHKYLVPFLVVCSTFTAVAPAFAEGYVQLSSTRLFCVVNAPDNYLATIPVSGPRINRDIAVTLKEVKKQKRNSNKLLKSLKAKAKAHNLSKKKKKKIKQAIAATKSAKSLLDTIQNFSLNCQNGSLNGLATSFIPGSGGGKK